MNLPNLQLNIILLSILIIFLIILVINLNNKNNIYKKELSIYKKELDICNQNIIPLVIKDATNKSQGKGVFANKNFIAGDIIEICPNIIDECDNFKGLSYNYIFGNYNKNNIDYCTLAFGYGSMYNHSNTPNAIWEIKDRTNFTITALNNIKKGDEIFISYGDKYWESRELVPT